MKRLLWFALGVIAGWVGNVATLYLRLKRKSLADTQPVKVDKVYKW